MSVVSLTGFTPGARYDGVAWTRARIEEAPNPAGPWTALSTVTLTPVDTDPARPMLRSFTVTNAVNPAADVFRVVFIDVALVEQASPAIRLPAAYAAVQDVRLALSPDGLADAATAASLSDAELADALSEAQSEVDARLAAHYPTPFPAGQVPVIVTAATRDIAAYLATLTFRRGEPLAPGDPVALRYQRALALLQDASRGIVELPAGPTSSPSQQVTVINAYEGTLFTLDDMALGLEGRSYRPAGWSYW